MECPKCGNSRNLETDRNVAEYACEACEITFNTPNARFWVLWNGDWYKLTLKPGQRVVLFSGGCDSEGCHYSAWEYEHVGDSVEHLTTEWGADCDGRYEFRTDSACPLSGLQSMPQPSGLPSVPAWQDMRASQRDYTAEAAGY